MNRLVSFFKRGGCWERCCWNDVPTNYFTIYFFRWKGYPPKKNTWPSWGTTKKTKLVLGSYFSVYFSRERITHPQKKYCNGLGIPYPKKRMVLGCNYTFLRMWCYFAGIMLLWYHHPSKKFKIVKNIFPATKSLSFRVAGDTQLAQRSLQTRKSIAPKNIGRGAVQIAKQFFWHAGW